MEVEVEVVEGEWAAGRGLLQLRYQVESGIDGSGMSHNV